MKDTIYLLTAQMRICNNEEKCWFQYLESSRIPMYLTMRYPGTDRKQISQAVVQYLLLKENLSIDFKNLMWLLRIVGPSFKVRVSRQSLQDIFYRILARSFLWLFIREGRVCLFTRYQREQTLQRLKQRVLHICGAHGLSAWKRNLNFTGFQFLLGCVRCPVFFFFSRIFSPSLIFNAAP